MGKVLTKGRNGLNQGDRFDYLDHGFVEVIDWHGSDETIAMAARASYNDEEYEDHERNNRLVKYMVEHRHTSPIEQVSITFRLKMPIFVMRQHVRHRTARLNEQSLRYCEHDGDFYVPKEERICGQHKTNKQMSGEQLSAKDQRNIKSIIDAEGREQYNVYKELLNAGCVRELARMVLGTNFYTTVVWQMDLHNLMHYLGLRNDSHAQWEIQQMAQIIQDVATTLFPASMGAYEKYVQNVTRFSEPEMEIIKMMLHDHECLQNYAIDEVDGSKRRAEDFLNKLR